MKGGYMRLLIIAFFIFNGCGEKNTTPPQQPSVSVNSVVQPEGNSGVTSFNFTLTLSNAYPQEVKVTWSTTEGSAKSLEDFTSVSNQVVTFQPNETVKQISVNVAADNAREGDDVFNVLITGTVNASLGQFSGTGTISNDDALVPFTNAGYDAPVSYPGYNLVWADEFNTGNLDPASWTVETGDGCPNLCGWGNNELEYYTDRSENIFFQDGKLLIEARKENYNGKAYTSSKIVSRGKKIFKYGRVDIRAKLPKGKGIWPALWMLPQNNVYGGWPTSGEIDIMEMIGHEPHRVYGTLHFGPGPGSTQISRNYTLPGSAIFNDEFHVFSLEWKMDQLKIYCDGNLYSTVNKADVGTATWPFNESFFFIFNLAVGGNWPGNPDATTYFPQWLIVDYIRVYQ